MWDFLILNGWYTEKEMFVFGIRIDTRVETDRPGFYAFGIFFIEVYKGGGGMNASPNLWAYNDHVMDPHMFLACEMYQNIV